MELTPSKCWDGKKHDWDAQHGDIHGWQVWCKKCGCKAVFRRKLVIAGKWELAKNHKGDPIFAVPEFFKHQEAS